jgi:type IX secretion system PorP/SprF family membrane protein
MNKYLLYMIVCLSIGQLSYSQEDNGVVGLALPVRNSLKFNKYAINPAFSFVREQHTHITFTAKREWVQFENAPQTYLFSYSGRFSENSGVGLGLFQQNYGVMTTFGGVFNYAYNVVLDRDSNLTFGVNLGAYQSGVNTGKIVTNFPDPSLDNIPSNTIITINPGINYGLAFFDFGVALNNLAAYNFTTSNLLQDNPEQSVQAHVMYTGYVDSRGFFDETKFSGLVRSEFKKDQTVISGIAMFTVPKGFWAQAGYNTLYGLSGGVGFNLSSQIALEYNYEKAMGNLITFGSSHEITLAYKFKNYKRYIYSGDDNESALIAPVKKPKVAVAKSQPTTTRTVRSTNIDTAAAEKAKADDAARLKLAEDQAKAQADEAARLKLAEEQAQARAAEEARLKLAQEQAKAKADEEARLKLAEEQAQARAAEAKLKLAQEQAKVKADEEAQARAAEEARLRLEQEQAKVAEIKEETREGIISKSADSNTEQYDLLMKLRDMVDSKQQDLKDLIRENDLSEQGIYSEPKPFKSVSAENAALEALKVNLENVIKAQNTKIRQMEEVYSKNANNYSDESVKATYLNRLNTLKAEQVQAIVAKDNLIATLNTIKEATEVERKRRIKKAVYDNEEDRLVKDRATLNYIKQNTQPSPVALTQNDFDFGEEQSKNIQILKGVNNVENGYYVVLAVHSDVAKRDEFLTKAVASGQKNINFFYDVNTSKYFIYYQKFNTLDEANNALRSSNNEPYNGKKSMVKIED